ncbi:MAG TPA: Dna2/Cas4 domain-containing protein [Candidatus Atribacteria bacterium]|nr:Dna2/Cas4 domain-containing protein [Candidatus Atribacteria bacterium]
MPPVEREFIFDGGRNIENLALQDLQEAGYKTIQQGRDFELKEQEITGHLDCLISDNGQNYPCEIKGISPFDFDKLNSAEDMLKSEKPYIRAYPAQLQLYLFMAAVNKLTSQEKPEGLFYIKNKLTFLPKEIWVELDYEYVEELLRKAERINKHIQNGTLPERIEDISVCLNYCPFQAICLPDIRRAEGIEILDDIEAERTIKRWFELKDAASEYAELDKRLKDYCQGKDKKILGDYLITGKKISKNLPAQQARTIEYWQKKIVSLTAVPE